MKNSAFIFVALAISLVAGLSLSKHFDSLGPAIKKDNITTEYGIRIAGYNTEGSVTNNNDFPVEVEELRSSNRNQMRIGTCTLKPGEGFDTQVYTSSRFIVTFFHKDGTKTKKTIQPKLKSGA